VTQEQFQELMSNWEASQRMAGDLTQNEIEIIESIVISIKNLFEKSLSFVDSAEPQSLINYIWMRDNSEYFELLDQAFRDHQIPQTEHLEDIAFLSFTQEVAKD